MMIIWAQNPFQFHIKSLPWNKRKFFLDLEIIPNKKMSSYKYINLWVPIFETSSSRICRPPPGGRDFLFWFIFSFPFPTFLPEPLDMMVRNRFSGSKRRLAAKNDDGWAVLEQPKRGQRSWGLQGGQRRYFGGLLRKTEKGEKEEKKRIKKGDLQRGGGGTAEKKENRERFWSREKNRGHH